MIHSRLGGKGKKWEHVKDPKKARKAPGGSRYNEQATKPVAKTAAGHVMKRRNDLASFVLLLNNIKGTDDVKALSENAQYLLHPTDHDNTDFWRDNC